MAKIKKKEYYIHQTWDRMDKVLSSLVALAYLETDKSYEQHIRGMDRKISNMQLELQSMYERIVRF
jgi:hypothetical protein